MRLAAVADLTGDGVLDLLGTAPDAMIAGVKGAGALYLFPGGSLLRPATVFAVPGAHPGDQLGR
jgi:hypothetical protein